jgi:uncharacterized protein (UPF0335 family)
MTMRSEAGADLKSFIERIERLGVERRELGDEQKALFAEAKARGFDPKAMRKIIKRRDKDPGELEEEETILETYMHALGMLPEAPLHRQVAVLAKDGLARDQVIDALQQLVPVYGEIIARVGGDPMRIWRDEAGAVHAEPYIEKPRGEKTDKAVSKPAAVLSIVPKDPVKAAADAAERRAREHRSEDEPNPLSAEVGADEDEPVT